MNQFNSYTDVLRFLNLDLKGTNYNRLKKFITDNNINISHFKLKENKFENSLSDHIFSDIVSKSGSIKTVCKKLNLNYSFYNKQVKSRIKSLCLEFNPEIKSVEENHWLKDEIELIKKNYEKISIDELQKLIPNKTRTAIKLQARKMNLFAVKIGHFNSRIDKLLNESLETYYWIGFIFADGHIDINKKRLTVAVSILDFFHLERLNKYIENKNDIKIRKKIAILSIMNTDVIGDLIAKFSISNRKTYNPPNKHIFDKMSNEQFISFLSGFIDGDGCIKRQYKRLDCTITIKCHNSWLEILNIYACKLSDIYTKKISNGKVNNKGYAVINIANKHVVTQLKKFNIDHNIPILSRKWDKISV
jgi:hypothetical protein